MDYTIEDWPGSGGWVLFFCGFLNNWQKALGARFLGTWVWQHACSRMIQKGPQPNLLDPRMTQFSPESPLNSYHERPSLSRSRDETL